VTAIIQDLQQVLKGMVAAQTLQLSDFLTEFAWKGKRMGDKRGGTGIFINPPLSPYTPSQTEMEQTIATVWQKAFGVDKIGIDDNFFDLGGYS